MFVYFDDLLITSATLEEHFYMLRFVAKQLTMANLTINVEKSRFVLKQIKYLGYVVGYGSLKVDSSKIEALVSYLVPRTTKQVRRFLGVPGCPTKYTEICSHNRTSDAKS